MRMLCNSQLYSAHSIKKYPKNKQIYINNLNPLNIQETEDLYFMMEGLLIDLGSLEILPESITHLHSYFYNLRKTITEEKYKKQINQNTISIVCKLYLQIFDLLPMYQYEIFTDEDWRIALTAKKLASSVINYNLVISNGYRKDLNRARLDKLKYSYI